MKAWAYICAVGVAVIVLACGTGIYYGNRNMARASVKTYSHAELLAAANAIRAEKGQAPLKLDERINTSAQVKANDLKNLGYFEHQNPKSGDRGFELVFRTFRECVYASENLNMGESGHNPFDNLHGWPSSPDHLAALVDPRYDYTGFGYVANEGKSIYVQHFCDTE